MQAPAQSFCPAGQAAPHDMPSQVAVPPVDTAQGVQANPQVRTSAFEKQRWLHRCIPGRTIFVAGRVGWNARPRAQPVPAGQTAPQLTPSHVAPPPVRAKQGKQLSPQCATSMRETKRHRKYGWSARTRRSCPGPWRRRPREHRRSRRASRGRRRAFRRVRRAFRRVRRAFPVRRRALLARVSRTGVGDGRVRGSRRHRHDRPDRRHPIASIDTTQIHRQARTLAPRIIIDFSRGRPGWRISAQNSKWR